jgi:CBS-domain-containing membrane protein
LNSLRGQSDVLGCFGVDRFAVMVPGADAEKASASAEQVRQALAAEAFQIRGASCRITASMGVAGCETAQSADELLEQAIAALETAKASGRNRVTRWADVVGETHEINSIGRLFERTHARDILTPCSVLLKADEPAANAAELMRQTQLECIPVVDRSGKLVGLCQRDHVADPSTDGHSSRLVRDVMTTDVQRFGADEDFATLMDFFSAETLAWAVVIDHGRPLGTLNCDSLLALSKPVSSIGPATRGEYSDSTEYLLVPDVAVHGDGEPELS